MALWSPMASMRSHAGRCLLYRIQYWPGVWSIPYVLQCYCHCSCLSFRGNGMMESLKQLNCKLTIVGPEETSLGELHQLRCGLHTEIGQIDEKVSLDPVLNYRALDPATVGAITMIIAPVLLDKLIDLLVDWTKRHREVSVMISIPLEHNRIATITYNPKNTSPEQLRSWVMEATQSVQSGHKKS